MNSNAPPSPPLPTTAQTAAAPGTPPRFPFSLMFLIWFAVLLTGTLVTFILPETFCSTVRIQVESDRSDIEDLSGKAGFNPYDFYFIPTVFEVIQSELFLTRVIDELDLNNAWGKKYKDGQKLKTQETVTLLRRRISVRHVRNTTIFEIQVYSGAPVEAAKLANTIAETYRQFRRDRALKLMIGGRKALEDKLKELDTKIRSAQEELASLEETVENPQLPDAKKQTYSEKKKDLDGLSDMHQLVMRRMTSIDLDANLPKNGQVIIVERAVPSLKPVRPIKQLNIVLSIIIGGFVGLLLAALVYLPRTPK